MLLNYIFGSNDIITHSRRVVTKDPTLKCMPQFRVGIVAGDAHYITYN